MNKNIAVVGCGYWGKNLVRNFYQLGVLNMICDSDSARLEEIGGLYPGIKQEVDPSPSDLQRMKELGMILQAQKDLSGIMMANREPKKGIEFLMERTYTI